jgi:enoyl-CoA hydratase/carnithine racemase
MALTVDALALRELVADPAAAETISAAADCPLVVVEAGDGMAAAALAELDITALPAVVIVIARDPACLPAGAFGAADVILSEDALAGAPFVAPEGGIAAGLARLGAVVGEHPVAAASLALLLRSSGGLPAPAGLVAESAAYSALQEGAEFRRWRATHEPRPAEPGTGRVMVETTAGELRITLARPARRNAVDWRMRDALAAALAIVVADPGVRVVLRGTGPDFCAGGDLDEFGSRPDPALAHIVRLTRSPALLLHRLSARTTAYLHGACLGAGIELPAFAGSIVAAPDTSISLPEIGLGLIPGAGGTVSLPRRIGRWRTAFLALTGTTIDARQALAWRLIDAVGAEPPRPISGAP